MASSAFAEAESDQSTAERYESLIRYQPRQQEIVLEAAQIDLRHGVTTVTVGSCSISTILSAPEDCSDLFTRVESVPRAQVLPLLLRHKSWSTPREFR